MEDSRKKKVLKQIQDLLRLGEDEGTTQAENEAATRKAYALMMKYNIEEHELNKQKPAGIEMVKYHMYQKMKGNEGKWIRYLFNAIAPVNFVKDIGTTIYKDGEAQPGLYLVGEMDNIKMVMFLAEQLIERIRVAERMAWSFYSGPDKRNTYRRGYFMGAVSGIRSQLEQAKEEFKAKESTAIMIIEKDKLVEQEVTKRFPSGLRRGRSSTTSSRAGYIKGQRDGSNMRIHAGVGGRSNNPHQLGS